jgi:hypothetical protein
METTNPRTGRPTPNFFPTKWCQLDDRSTHPFAENPGPNGTPFEICFIRGTVKTAFLKTKHQYCHNMILKDCDPVDV